MTIQPKNSIVRNSSVWTARVVSQCTTRYRAQARTYRLKWPVRMLFLGLGILLGLVLFLAPVATPETIYFLHSDGNTRSPGPSASASLFSLNGISPTAAQAKCRDSAAVNRSTFEQIDGWSIHGFIFLEDPSTTIGIPHNEDAS